MPDLDGIEVGRQIHTIDPSVPIIAFTLLDAWGLESAARNAGILRVISKSEGWKLVESIEQIASEFEDLGHQSKSKAKTGMRTFRQEVH